MVNSPDHVLLTCDCFRVLALPPWTSSWMPIENLKNRRVVERGRFAVQEHNRLSRKNLKFQSVISGATLVIRLIQRINIRMVIKAKDGNADHKYNVTMYKGGSLE